VTNYNMDKKVIYTFTDINTLDQWASDNNLTDDKEINLRRLQLMADSIPPCYGSYTGI